MADKRLQPGFVLTVDYNDFRAIRNSMNCAFQKSGFPSYCMPDYAFQRVQLNTKKKLYGDNVTSIYCRLSGDEKPFEIQRGYLQDVKQDRRFSVMIGQPLRPHHDCKSEQQRTLKQQLAGQVINIFYENLDDFLPRTQRKITQIIGHNSGQISPVSNIVSPLIQSIIAITQFVRASQERHGFFLNSKVS